MTENNNHPEQEQPQHPQSLTTTFSLWWKRRHRFVEEIMLLAILMLILTGVGLTNISPAKSYHFWSVMIFLFGLVGLVIGVFRSREKGLVVIEEALDQIVHWGATFVAVAIVYLMLGAGRLTYEATSLMILLLLGLAMFLDGYYRVGWRFSLLGILVIVLDLGIAYLQAYMWPILIMGGLLWPASILAEIYLMHRKAKKKQAA